MSDLKLPQNVLTDKTNVQLIELSDDDSKLLEFFSSLKLDNLENMKKKKEELVAENKQISSKTCALKPKFEELKASLISKMKETEVLKLDYDRRLKELKALSSRDSHGYVLKQLQQAKREEEQKSETLVESFLSKSSSSIEEFLSEYLKMRRTYWLRKVKAEKLEELMKAMPPKPAPRAALSSSAVPKGGGGSSSSSSSSSLSSSSSSSSSSSAQTAVSQAQPAPSLPQAPASQATPLPSASLPPSFAAQPLHATNSLRSYPRPPAPYQPPYSQSYASIPPHPGSYANPPSTQPYPPGPASSGFQPPPPTQPYPPGPGYQPPPPAHPGMYTSSYVPPQQTSYRPSYHPSVHHPYQYR